MLCCYRVFSVLNSKSQINDSIADRKRIFHIHHLFQLANIARTILLARHCFGLTHSTGDKQREFQFSYLVDIKLSRCSGQQMMDVKLN
jgi:hypothetical protein